jgi:hypothetical protein
VRPARKGSLRRILTRSHALRSLALRLPVSPLQARLYHRARHWCAINNPAQIRSATMKSNTHPVLKLVLENLPAILSALAALLSATAAVIKAFGHG